MKICQVDPGCGIPIPPPSWGAIEKIVWEFHNNINKLGHTSQIQLIQLCYWQALDNFQKM